ncbi:hypothetical protein BC941DRAFT_182151 [Chlamydoabsidia padenii]|nr:hypothetical protein BC941DRAFT_182151 [Chlamydoabsidia padenii]
MSNIGLSETTGDAFPFSDLRTILLHSFIYGDDARLSRRIMQKVMYLLVLMLKIYEKSRESGVLFKSPALDALYNYQQRKKSKVPVLTTTQVDIPGSDSRSYHLNLAPTYLNMLVGNPVRSKKTSALPDYTPNRLLHLQQGQKWRTHHLLQQPVITINRCDYWVGDIISVANNGSPIYLLIDSYFTKSGEIFGRCYDVILLKNGSCLLCFV